MSSSAYPSPLTGEGGRPARRSFNEGGRPGEGDLLSRQVLQSPSGSKAGVRIRKSGMDLIVDFG